MSIPSDITVVPISGPSRLGASGALGSRDWQMALNAVPDAVLLIDQDCRIVFANTAAADLTAGSAQALVGQTCYAALHGTCEPPPECPHQQLVATRRAHKRERVALVPGRLFDVTTSPWIDDQGAMAGCILVLHDVTERVAVEQEMRRQALTFATMHDAAVAMDESGRILDWNPAAERQFGYRRDEVLGRTTSFLHPPSEGDLYSEIGNAVRCSGNWEGEHQFLRKDGTEGTCESILVTLAGEENSQRVTIGICRDVTERKRAEKELRDSERKYRGLFENSIYGIYRSLPDGTLLDVNQAMVEMLGYTSRSELLNRNLTRDIYLDPSVRMQIIRECQEAGSVKKAEANWKCADGNKIRVRLSGRNVEGPGTGGNHMEVIVENITSQHLLEEQLRQAQKMEAVGTLAGGVAHDFNNLLGVILGYSDLLQEDPEVTESTRTRIAEIKKAAQRGVEVTRQLLAFSRKQVLEPRTLDLNGVVRDMSKMLKRLLREDIELVADLAPELGFIKADPTQMEQILMNLAINARDAMPNGGSLTIETRNVELDESYSRRHLGIAPGNYVMIGITDTGSGMDSETQKHIFEPFFTTKEKGKGTGLGLSTVYGIVKQSGGYIWVYSEPGIGTTFKVYMPRIESRKASVSNHRQMKLIEGGNETILLVEDDDSLRELNEMMLKSLGYTVLTASDGTVALGIAQHYAERIHLLMTDVVMPGINGLDLAAQLEKLRPGIRTLLVSGYSDRTIPRSSARSGLSFLQKPFSRDRLATRLRELLDSARNPVASPSHS